MPLYVRNGVHFDNLRDVIEAADEEERNAILNDEDIDDDDGFVSNCGDDDGDVLPIPDVINLLVNERRAEDATRRERRSLRSSASALDFATANTADDDDVLPTPY